MARLRSLIDELDTEYARHKKTVRDVYQRVAKFGYDKTAVGQVVLIRRRHADDAEAFSKASSLVQEYLTEVGFIPVGGLTPTCARESIQGQEDRPLTIKERARAIIDFSEAKKRGEIPQDAELPERIARSA